MPDGDFRHLLHPGDIGHRLIGQPMPGMAQQTRTPRSGNTRLQPRQLRGAIRHRPFGISACVQFNRSRANRGRRFNLRRIGFNEDGNPYIGRAQPRHGLTQKRPGAQHVQAAFRGQFRTLFRNDAAIGRANTFRKSHHFLGRRHLKI